MNRIANWDTVVRRAFSAARFGAEPCSRAKQMAFKLFKLGGACRAAALSLCFVTGCSSERGLFEVVGKGELHASHDVMLLIGEKEKRFLNENLGRFSLVTLTIDTTGYTDNEPVVAIISDAALSYGLPLIGQGNYGPYELHIQRTQWIFSCTNKDSKITISQPSGVRRDYVLSVSRGRIWVKVPAKLTTKEAPLLLWTISGKFDFRGGTDLGVIEVHGYGRDASIVLSDARPMAKELSFNAQKLGPANELDKIYPASALYEYCPSSDL